MAEMVGPFSLQGPLAAGTIVLSRKPRCRPRARACARLTPSFIAFPGSLFSSKSHYGVFLRGDTPVTSRLLKPVLVDAADGAFSRIQQRPALVCLDLADLAAAPLRRLWRHAAEDHLGGFSTC